MEIWEKEPEMGLEHALGVLGEEHKRNETGKLGRGPGKDRCCCPWRHLTCTWALGTVCLGQQVLA